MIKLKTLLMEADAPKLKDTEKEKAKKLGLVWKGKGYGKEGQDGITHKNDGGKLVKIDKDGGKEDPKSKGLSGSDFDRELPSDDKPKDDKPEVGTKVKDGKIKSSGPQQFADDIKNIKGEYDLGAGMKIKDGKMFDADGNEMDSDDIEDFYYQDAFDGDGNNIGIDVKEKPKSDEPKKAVDSEDLDAKDFEAAKQTFDKIKDIDMDEFEYGPEGYDQMMDAFKSLKGTKLDNYKPLQSAIDDLQTNQDTDSALLVRDTLNSLKDKKDPFSGKYLGDDIEDAPKKVEVDDEAQEVIDSFDWNEFGDRNGDPNLAKTTNEMGGMTDEWNAQINNVYDEMERLYYDGGKVPVEDLNKLASANIDDDYGSDLDDVPRDEFRDKIKILIDFHKKYSTIGKKTTAQEKDPNRKKVSGIKPGSSFGSNIGYRTGRNRGGGMYDNVNIKLKDIMRESKVSYLVEALQSKLLRKFTNRQDFKLDNDFYGWLARLGVRADKVTDDMIEKTAKLSGKGVVIAVTGKKVSLPAKGKSYWRSDLEVDKGVVLSVFKDGKAVWWTKSWRESEKNRKKDIRVADTKGYGFSTSENRTFGLNQFGYQNAASVKKINGVEFYKISLEENMPYMGGKEVRKLRSDIQVGSWKWRDDESFKRQNKDKYEDAIKAMYDDPEKVKAKVKRAKDYTDGLITGLIGGKPNAAAKKLLKGLSSTRAPEMQAMELMRNITDAMDRLYDKVTYYNNAVKDDIDYEKRNPEHPKSYRNSPRYGKEVAEIVNMILKNKFTGYF